MALPTVFKFGDGVLYLAAPATTPTYQKICGFTEDQLEFSKETGTTILPDCDNPDLAPWAAADVTSLGWNQTFSGVIAKEALSFLEDATLSSAAYLVRFYIKGGGTGGGTPDRLYQGTGHVTMTLSGTRGEKRKVEIKIAGDGALVKSSVAMPA
jgi:hypothetical protein